MTLAILSCVHANLPALEAVLADVRRRGIRRLVSLGDVVGYGDHPRECLRLLFDVEIAIMGNHEEAIMFYGEDFNPRARASLERTKDALNDSAFSSAENYDLWNFLGTMQQVVERDGVMFTHGSPRVPTREYVVPADSQDADKMAGIFDLVDRVCFIGHSHIPHVYASGGWDASPAAIGSELDLRSLPGRKVLVNVGSVGRSRDGDERACYVTFDGHVVRFHRVDYIENSATRR